MYGTPRIAFPLHVVLVFVCSLQNVTLLPPAGVVLPASLCASLCAPILVNPLLDERVSGVPEEPELHLKIYVRSVSDGMWSPWTSPVWHVRSPSWMVVPETSFGKSPLAVQGTAPLAQCKLSSCICDFGVLCLWPELLLGGSPRIVLFAKLSPGLMSLAIMTTNLFQFRFADTEQYWHSSCLISLTLFRTDNKHVPVWCAFACFGWKKLTLTASSGIPKKFLVGQRTWDQKLSSGLMLLNSRLPIPLCRH